MSSAPSGLGAATVAPSPVDDAGAPADPPYATWLSRVLAMLIDVVVVTGVPLFIAGVIFVMANDGESIYLSTGINLGNLAHHHEQGAFFSLVFCLAIRLLNEGVLQGRVGQSIGKRFLRIAVVDAQERRTFIGPRRGVLRVLVDYAWGIPAAFIGLLTVIPLLNYVWPLGDRHKQTWTDQVVTSVVVSIR